MATNKKVGEGATVLAAHGAGAVVWALPVPVTIIPAAGLAYAFPRWRLS